MTEHSLAPSWDGSVVLDIGGDVGALLLRTGATMVGHEIDLIPDDRTLPSTHSAVRVRLVENGASFAAVYPHLRAGTYTITGTAQRVAISGGLVTELEYLGTHIEAHAPEVAIHQHRHA
jgi:glutamine synthetase